MKTTLRQRIAELLMQGECTARDISQMIGIREKEVHAHLPHVARSLSARKIKLHVTPSVCTACGYVFKDRSRFRVPGRCPKCRCERITEPVFRAS